METQHTHRLIKAEVVVNANTDDVWHAWTTEEGITSFFSPACNVELRVGGAYEIFFNPEAEPGNRGAEGMQIMAFQQKRMLAFTWCAPPHLASIRHQLTHVQINLSAAENQMTKLTLIHSGWGAGGEWDEAYDYFQRAWKDIVLPRLKYRFLTGAIDWDAPPNIPADE